MNKEAGAEEKFKEISNAYEVLTDDNKRGIYDRSSLFVCSQLCFDRTFPAAQLSYLAVHFP